MIAIGGLWRRAAQSDAERRRATQSDAERRSPAQGLSVDVRFLEVA